MALQGEIDGVEKDAIVRGMRNVSVTGVGTSGGSRNKEFLRIWVTTRLKLLMTIVCTVSLVLIEWDEILHASQKGPSEEIVLNNDPLITMHVPPRMIYYTETVEFVQIARSLCSDAEKQHYRAIATEERP